MKWALRRQPEDFVVEELTNLKVGSGPFALYRLQKRGIGTPEALSAIAQKWRIDEHRIAWAGLKDRHALTTQYITIHFGPHANLTQANFRLEYVGQLPRAIESKDISANRFQIVVRRLQQEQAHWLLEQLGKAATQGWPNYFDEQRFGSCGFTGDFVVEPWCIRDFERALWLALADPYRHDSAAERREKQWLRYYWGRWPEAAPWVKHPVRRRVVRFLVDHPHDYRRAFARIPVTLRRIYVSAFQSFLWNALASRFLQQYVPPSERVYVEIGGQALVVPRWTDEQDCRPLRHEELPLPSARQRDVRAPIGDWLDELLGSRGLQLRQLYIPYPRDTFFSKGTRPIWVHPTDMSYRVSADACYQGWWAVNVEFQLPRGSYATMLFRCLGAMHGS